MLEENFFEREDVQKRGSDFKRPKWRCYKQSLGEKMKKKKKLLTNTGYMEDLVVN